MKRKYFGTDGVRGRVGTEPITPDFVMKLGYAAGKVLARTIRDGGERPAVLIGKDTRVSGYMLESALEAGLAAAGVDVLLVGPMPTPAVAYLTRALRLSSGIVISASHNPYDDNGIKFFSGDGNKLPDRVETAIEAELSRPLACSNSAQLGKARRIDDAAGRYIEFCKSTFPQTLDLRGMRMVVDTAHGATYHIAPHVFHELGAEVVAIGDQPDGFNINAECGATHPDALQAAVREHSADLGIALDGDGDRLVMVDAQGAIYDGDQLLYVIACDRRRRRRLAGGVVGTQMTNLALEHAFGALKIGFARARVGDRYVLELMQARGWELGGENSGHIICLDRHTTGDGIVSALQVLAALRSRKITLAAAASAVTLYPQVLINVPTGRRIDAAADRAVKRAVAAATDALGDSGRVLLRPSGTEPVLRVMVEGKTLPLVQHWAETLAECVRRAAAHDGAAVVRRRGTPASRPVRKVARAADSLRISKTSGRIRARQV
jgi:phosphoglucosamine mutase